MFKPFSGAYLCTIVVLILIGCASTQSRSPEPKTLLHFARFVLHFTNRNPLDYIGYGCWYAK